MELTRTAGRPMGLQLHHGRAGVLIRRVLDNSAISEWNAAHPSMQVRSGDILVAVNGIYADGTKSSWRATLEELRKSNVVLVVSHIRAGDVARYLSYMSEPPNTDHLLPDNFMDLIPHLPASKCNVTECSICLAALDPDVEVVQLPCRHAFHRDCVEQWLTQRLTYSFAKCPMCRKQIPHDFHYAQQGSEPQKLSE